MKAELYDALNEAHEWMINGKLILPIVNEKLLREYAIFLNKITLTLKAAEDENPTPWCPYCSAKTKSKCICDPKNT